MNKRVLDLPTLTSVLSTDYIVIDRPAGTSNVQLSAVTTLVSNVLATTFVPTIQDSTISTTKMIDGAVTTSKLADRSVTTIKLALSAVTDAELADNAVKTRNISNSSITSAKLSSSVVNLYGGLALDSTNGLSVSTGIRPEYIINSTLTLADSNNIIPVNNANPITITIPSDAITNFTIGTNIVVYQKGLGQVSIVGYAGVTVLSNESKNKTTGQYSSVALFKLTTNTWLLGGDLV